MGNSPNDISLPENDKNCSRNSTEEAGQSLSTIALRASLNSSSDILSHRSLNRRHQMLIAEAIHDESKSLVLKSRLDKSYCDTITDQESLAYFVQYMESCGSISKHLIRLWVQLDCFQRFSAECQPCDQEQFKSDAEGIWEKFLANGRYSTLGIDEKIISVIDKKLNNSSSNKIDNNIFAELTKWLVKHMEEKYFTGYTKSYFHCKYQVTLLTSGDLRLTDVLYHDRTLFYFMEFMDHESMNNYVDFLVMGQNCRKSECTREDLLILFQRFFNPESQHYLDMSDSVRCYTEEAVKRGDKKCFDKAMSILIQYLSETFFPQFLSSQTFFSFLDESIRALHLSSEESSHRQRHDSGKSEHSSASPRVSSSSFAENSDKSTNQKNSHEDIDVIWKRNCDTDLQMATVDQYGKVFSHFLPDPRGEESANSFSLSKAVKIFRNNSVDEKMQEDYAYRVAQRIVNDIRTVTESSNTWSKNAPSR